MTGGETLASRRPVRRRRHSAALQKTRAKWKLRIRFIKPEISHVVPTLVRSMNNALKRNRCIHKEVCTLLAACKSQRCANHSFLAWLWSDDKNACWASHTLDSVVGNLHTDEMWPISPQPFNAATASYLATALHYRLANKQAVCNRVCMNNLPTYIHVCTMYIKRASGQWHSRHRGRLPMPPTLAVHSLARKVCWLTKF
jgi:hypothetical protein